MTEHYVYLFHTKEFVDSKEPVYKIGKSTKPNFERFQQYAEGTRFHFQMSCHNCHDLENKIIALFKTKYELHCGREYFKGNYHCMVQDICRIIIDEKEDVKFEEVVQYWFEDVEKENVVDDKDDDKVVKNEANDEDVNDEDDEDEVLCSIVCTTARYFCPPCGYPARSKSNLAKHYLSKKHKDKIENPDAVIEGAFKCPNCIKTYKGYQGLWSHKKVCKANPTAVAITPEADLLTKIDNLERIIMDIARNQQNTHNDR